VKTFSNEIGAFGNAQVKVIQDGPVKAIVRVVNTYGNSILTIDWSLTKGSKTLKQMSRSTGMNIIKC